MSKNISKKGPKSESRIIGQGYKSTFEEELEDTIIVVENSLVALIVVVAMMLVVFSLFFVFVYI